MGWRNIGNKTIEGQWEDLANAIIIQAAADYSRLKIKNSVQSKNEVESILRFFNSIWYRALTSVDSGYIINNL